MFDSSDVIANAGAILGQNCVWISNAIIDDFFFFQKFVLSKAV